MDGCVVERLPSSSGEMSVCRGDFCCHLSYESPSLEDAFFLLVVNGPTAFIPAQACMVTVCQPVNGEPCAVFPTRSRTRFTRLRLAARYSTPYLFPVLASDELVLTSVRRWTFETSSDNVTTLAIDEGDPPAEPILHVFVAAFMYQNDPTTRPEYLAEALRLHRRSRVPTTFPACPTRRDVCATDEGPSNKTATTTTKRRRRRHHGTA